MKILRVCKAEPITQASPEIEGIQIIINDPIGINELNIEETQTLFEHDARHLQIALKESLPGGVYTRLLAFMLADFSKNNFNGITLL